MYSQLRRNIMRLRNFIVPVLTLVLLAGCSKPGSRRSAGNAQQQAIQAVSVMAEEVTPQSINDYLHITGTLEGATEVVMISELAGTIKEVTVSLGDWIEAGETLGSLDAPQYGIQVEQARASYLAAKAAFDAAELSRQSAEVLWKEHAISESEYQQTMSSYTSAQAGCQGAQANLEMAQNTYEASIFTAPVSGWITYLPIQQGDYASMGTQLCKIVDDRTLVIRTAVSSGDVTSLSTGQSSTITVHGMEGAHPATVTAVGKSPAPQSSLYPVEITVPNPSGALLSGMMASIQIQRGTFENALATAVENIRQSYDDRYVYIVASNNTAQRQIVTLGAQVNGSVIITSGLYAGDQIITEGIDSLNDGTPVAVRQSAPQEG
jgi:RND family efflux transporter MFP subunit